MSDRESLQKVAKSSLHSLVKQTAQVGIGFGVMLVATGGAPSPIAVALTTVGGIAFVAVSEERRLDAEHKQFVEKHRRELEKED